MASAKSRSPGANKLVVMLDTKSVLPYSLNEGVATYQELTHLPDVSLSASASYHDDNLLGRSEPFKSYSFSNPTQISFTGLIVVEGELKDRNIATELTAGALGLTGRFVSASAPFIGPAGKLISKILPKQAQESIVKATFLEVTQKAAWFESLTKPQYDLQGYAYPPPHVLIFHGQNFKRRGVITNVHLTYKGPWEVSTLLSMLVEVTLTFQEDNLVPKGFLDVVNLKDPQKVSVEEQPFGAQAAIDNARSLVGL